jgi:two-component system NtrC family sensor kinase
MNILGRMMHKIVFSDETSERNGAVKHSRYWRMWRNTVVVVAAVSIIPLVTMSLVNYVLYRQSFKKEITQPIHRLTAITKRSVESFLEERIAAAEYILSRESMDELYSGQQLSLVFKRMRNSFGGIVDIGVIDSEGVMRSYAGPYDLLGKEYKNQDWFNKVMVRDVCVSDVFLGHRKLPHFIIAVKRVDELGRVSIFRATIDTEVLNKQIQAAGLAKSSDAFIINRNGILQTPSRLFGPPLGTFPGDLPPFTEGSEINDSEVIKGKMYLMGYSYISRSPFVFLILADKRGLMRGWLTYQGEVLALLTLSIIAILFIIMGITSNWVTRIKEADIRREATLHNIEHTNKMASIGRLAAGVAHEINNPLAIVNEKAGLIQDIVGASQDYPNREKLLKQVDQILNSVKRCSDITHRLLGFARHMDVKSEPVAVDALIRDVLGFLEKEASYRNIEVAVNVSDTLPTIKSDKGQLQQLFLNIINNAFDAIGKNGNVVITIEDHPPESVAVTIADDGQGIPRENLERIFEPFFTTRKGKGTGLGLSISYGIVQKLRGTMTVESEVGKGTSFKIVLPVVRKS